MSARCEARFYVKSIETFTQGGEQGTVTLAVACKGDRNRSWAQATPSGEIRMTVNNPAGFAFFKDLLGGADLAVTFEPISLDLNDPAKHPFRPSEQEPGQSWPGPGQCGDCSMSEDAHKPLP